MAFSFSPPVSRCRRYCLLTVFVVCLAVFVSPLHSKNVVLTAIELYDGPNGPAYVHITDVLINGKVELRSCGSTEKIDKSAYGKLPRVVLAPGMALEYGKDDVLTLAKDGAATCVVPGNLKFIKNGPVTAAQLASQAVLQAKILSTGADANQPAPALKPGVKLVFVVSADVELAEFLRTERASTIPQWQDYLGKFPTAVHAPRAKEALTSLFIQAGSSSLDAYRKSLASSARDYAALRNAKVQAAQAIGRSLWDFFQPTKQSRRRSNCVWPTFFLALR